jgi:hypothetical protein
MTVLRGTAGAMLLVAAAIACANVRPPVAKVLAPLDRDLERVVFVSTTRSREDVVAAFKRSGFRVATDARETSIVVEVRHGGVRNRDDHCGTLQNVSYVVIQGGVRAAIIKGRGWTSPSCDPNIYAQMNLVLAHLFGQGPYEEAGGAKGTGRARP